MARSGHSRADENRAIRQEALREQLSKQKHVEHVIEICTELNDLSIQLEQGEVARKKIVLDTKLKLINKYLPDLKNTEISNDGGGQLIINIKEVSD